MCRDPADLLRAHTRWCWRLKLPVVWTERLSPYSRYGRVRLDLFTTPYRLSAEAQVKLRDLASRAITSPHDVCLERIPKRDLDRLAAAVLRIAVTQTNLQLVRDYRVVVPVLESSEVLRWAS